MNSAWTFLSETSTCFELAKCFDLELLLLWLWNSRRSASARFVFELLRLLRTELGGGSEEEGSVFVTLSSLAFMIRRKVVLDPAPRKPDFDDGLAPIPSKEVKDELYWILAPWREVGGALRVFKETAEFDFEKEDFGDENGETSV